MKNFAINSISLLLLILTISSCSYNKSKKIIVSGEKNLSYCIADIDSVVIDNIDISGHTNTFIIDSCLVISDNLQCKLFLYDLTNGKPIGTRLGYGHGPNELAAMLYAQPLQYSNNEIVIIDNSNGLYFYDINTDHLEYTGVIDFNWKNETRNEYDDISNYKLMEMTDFAMSFVKVNNKILAPLSIINRNFDDCNSDRYEKGHIFTYFDCNDLKASRPIGRFPLQYIRKPLPYFEFFDFTVDSVSKRIYYTFAPDQMIYEADMQGNPLKAFGFEPTGINRDYTTGYNVDIEAFKADIQKVGVNTGIFFDIDRRLIFRTSLQNFEQGKIILQIYDTDGNLVAEQNMPRYFKMLGRYKDRYYGINLLPLEKGDDQLIYLLYSFDILPGQPHQDCVP